MYGFLGPDNIWPRYNYLKTWNLREQKNLVQMKLLMHITNTKLSMAIFTVGNLKNIFMEHDLNVLMIFVIKDKWIILSHTMYFGY